MSTDATDPNDGAWTTVQADNGRGAPLILRVRTDLGDETSRAKWQGRMTVTWTYPVEDAQTRQGLPTPDQLAAMDRFEDAIVQGVEKGGVAILTSVATTSGTREWVWYCGPTPDFNKAFNASLKGHPRYPLALRVNQDPAWAGYRALLRAIGV